MSAQNPRGGPGQNDRTPEDWRDRIKRLVHDVCLTPGAATEREAGLFELVVRMVEWNPLLLAQDDDILATKIYLVDWAFVSAPRLMALAGSERVAEALGDPKLSQKAYFWGLVARLNDEVWGVREHEPLPLYVLLLVYLWAGCPELAPVLEDLEPHLRALRFSERDLMWEELDEEERRDVALTALSALYLAREGLTPQDVRTLVYSKIQSRVQGRQRQEMLAELPQALREIIKPKTQKKMHIESLESHDPSTQPSPVVLDERPRFPSLSEIAERLGKKYAGLSPAERNAILDALDRSRRSGRDLTEYWGGKDSTLYKRKIKAFERGLERIKSGRAAAP